MKDQNAVYLEEVLGRQLPAAAYHPGWSKEERDRAKRATDIINECIHDIGVGTLMSDAKSCWLAFRLSDGSSDRVLYESKADAVKHQLHEQQCAYICMVNLMKGAKEREILRFFRFTEMAYNQGFRLPDPSDTTAIPDLLPTAKVMDRIAGRTPRPMRG